MSGAPQRTSFDPPNSHSSREHRTLNRKTALDIMERDGGFARPGCLRLGCPKNADADNPEATRIYDFGRGLVPPAFTKRQPHHTFHASMQFWPQTSTRGL
uniref:Uncharacterized protein n=1 Tax=Mycena chlorophos TaxID=658473 RepID=A0ABQ0L2S5_MYCCL|nr:predicted protein [Mycena chlorophos]